MQQRGIQAQRSTSLRSLYLSTHCIASADVSYERTICPLKWRGRLLKLESVISRDSTARKIDGAT